MSDGLYDGRYVVRGYYDNAFMGLADSYGLCPSKNLRGFQSSLPAVTAS